MDPAQVPENRIPALRQLVDVLSAVQRIALITHVNADGDGAGSEAAVAAWLRSRGKDVHITNPTIYPENFRYLIEPSWVVDYTDGRADSIIRNADVVFVLDTGEPKRTGRRSEEHTSELQSLAYLVCRLLLEKKKKKKTKQTA